MLFSSNYKKYSPSAQIITSSNFWDSDYILTKDEQGLIYLFITSISEDNFVSTFENEHEVQSYLEEEN